MPRPPTICVVLSEHLANDYTGPLVRGAAAAARSLGCRLMIYSRLTFHISRRVLPPVDLPLLPTGADGYFLPAFVTDEVVASCERLGAPVVTFAGARPGTPAIVPDNRAGAREATAHLIAHGRRRIVHIMGVRESQEAHERLAGYREALEAAGIPFDPALVVPGDFQVLIAEDSIDRLLRDGVAFDAIFSTNDLGARGALNALASHGRTVPGDVAVVGFDDSHAAASAVPPLASVRQSPFQIGFEGVRLLAATPRHARLPERTMVPVRLVSRESCGCPPSAGHREDWAGRLAESFGRAQGLFVAPADVEAWAVPLERALRGQDALAPALDTAYAAAERRSWHAPAIREYLAGWRERSSTPTADERAAEALAYVAGLADERAGRWQVERTRRVHAITYVIEELRGYNTDQPVETALRYLVGNGPREALSIQPGPQPGTLACQLAVAAGSASVWHGPAEAFPPPEWLGPSEAMLLMPLEAGGQQVLLGVVEREGYEHLDLDDLLLRSINTYRSITMLNETLRELDAARSVQQSLLPRRPPPSEDYDIAGATRPARQVGGDLYGYYVRPSGSLAVAIGDVAGKGMPAALLMSACATALAGTISAGLAPSLTLSQVHQMLHPSVGRGQNAAVCLVYLDGPRVRIANAGAVAPLIRTVEGVRIVEIGGLPLGTPLSDARPYAEVEERLAPGDVLVLSSDGIVEAVNERGELFGFERFLKVVERGPRESAQAMLAHIFAEVAAFTGAAEVRDDMAAVIACFRGCP